MSVSTPTEEPERRAAGKPRRRHREGDHERRRHRDAGAGDDGAKRAAILGHRGSASFSAPYDPNSGKNTQAYTGQKTRAYGQANGSGVVTVVCPS